MSKDKDFKILSLLNHRERTLFSRQVEKVFKWAKRLCRGAIKQQGFASSSLVGMGLVSKAKCEHKNQPRAATLALVLEKVLVAAITAKCNELVKRIRKAVKGEHGGMPWGGHPALRPMVVLRIVPDAGDFLDRHNLADGKPLVELAKELDEPACEREFGNELLEGSCDDASADAMARQEHLWSQVLHGVVVMQEMKKGILAHRSEGTAEFIPTLWKRADMATEAMAVLVMGKSRGQHSAEHMKEQEAVEATGAPRTPGGCKKKGVSLATAKNQMAHRALCERIKVARSADGMKVRGSQKVAQEGEGDKSNDAMVTCQGWCD
jgi:hypothetical protein